MRLHRVLVPLALIAWIAPAAAEPPPSDPRAVAIADRVIEALGGRERWNDLRGLRWGFGVERNDTVLSLRRHAWDKHTGWHRVEGKTRTGEPFCYVENLHDGSGRAWVGGAEIAPDSAAKLVALARRMWTNDTYWLLMPYKLRDPGVILGWDGEVTDSTGSYDRITLAFDNVGQTPGDRYWVYVNRANQRVERWDYLLQGRQPPPEHATWEGWIERGGLWFPTSHRKGDDDVFTRDIETVNEFRPAEFSAP